MKYRPDNRFEAAFDPARCAEAVHDTGRSVGFHQCGRKWKVEDANGDRWCAQHDPKVRDGKRAAREQERQNKERREAEWRRRMNAAASKVQIAAQLHWQPFVHEYEEAVVVSLEDFERLTAAGEEK